MINTVTQVFDFGCNGHITLKIQGYEQAYSLLNDLPDLGLAIVGTRAPHPQSVRHLKAVVQSISKTNLIIVSGFARGIDGAAHECALQNGLRTIAFLPTGIMQNYPQEHRELRKKIIENGGLICSEFPDHQNAFKSNFLKRNRLLVLFSKATWVVQAGYQSGAMNTAKWAIEFEKPLFTTPCFPGDMNYCGNEHLLKQPQVTPLWSAEDLSQVWFNHFSNFSEIPITTKKTDLLPGIEKYIQSSNTRFEALESWCKDHNEKLENWVFTLEKSQFFD